jgi:imidazolonepropionase-like amidohydrolase
MGEGVLVCFGTDSAASGTTLDIRAEMRDFLAAFPSVRPGKALEMATLAAAKALNQEGITGTLSIRSCADMIAVPLTSAADDPAEAVVAGRDAVSWMMVNGKVVRDEL